jgi:hypothetical protein
MCIRIGTILLILAVLYICGAFDKFFGQSRNL